MHQDVLMTTLMSVGRGKCLNGLKVRISTLQERVKVKKKISLKGDYTSFWHDRRIIKHILTIAVFMIDRLNMCVDKKFFFSLPFYVATNAQMYQ